jgi:invasion protein IalB
VAAVMSVVAAVGVTQTSLSSPASGQSRQQAQAAPPKPTASPAKPAARAMEADVTTASFGDWQMICRMTNAGGAQPPRRICEVLQSVVLKGQTAPFAQLGFGRLEPGAPLTFTAVVPVNISFPSSVRVAVDGADKQPLEAAWTRCLPSGCFASVTANNDILKRWQAQDRSGWLMFKSGTSQDLRVPVSFKGLARALDALAKEH